VVLRGQVDRIDDVDGLGPVVVDYKTGKLNKTAPSWSRNWSWIGSTGRFRSISALAATEGPRRWHSFFTR
jgi:hypothetical protein